MGTRTWLPASPRALSAAGRSFLENPRRNFALPCCTVLLAFPLVVLVASYIDKTWFIQGEGRGLFEHYGALTAFASGPVLVAIGSLILNLLRDTLTNLKNFTGDGELSSELQAVAQYQLDSLALQRRSKWFILLFFVVGLLFTAINIRQTWHPEAVYGNDIFDGRGYIYGTIAFKLYIFLLWSFIYPYLGFVLLHATATLVIVLRLMCRKGELRVDFFHEDNCGGLSIFGKINMLVMLSYVCLLGTLLAILLTHNGNYDTINTALISFSLLFLIQSLAGVYHIHRLLVLKKKEQLARINKALNILLLKPPSTFARSANLLGFRNHVAQVRTFPYTREMNLLVNLLRFAPVAVALLNILYPR